MVIRQTTLQDGVFPVDGTCPEVLKVSRKRVVATTGTRGVGPDLRLDS